MSEVKPSVLVFGSLQLIILDFATTHRFCSSSPGARRPFTWAARSSRLQEVRTIDLWYALKMCVGWLLRTSHRYGTKGSGVLEQELRASAHAHTQARCGVWVSSVATPGETGCLNPHILKITRAHSCWGKETLEPFCSWGALGLKENRKWLILLSNQPLLLRESLNKQLLRFIVSFQLPAGAVMAFKINSVKSWWPCGGGA